LLVRQILDQLRKHHPARVHPALLPLRTLPQAPFRPRRFQIVPGANTAYPAGTQSLTPTSHNFPRTAVIYNDQPGHINTKGRKDYRPGLL
jgi:hypothetical protein